MLPLGAKPTGQTFLSIHMIQHLYMYSKLEIIINNYIFFMNQNKLQIHTVKVLENTTVEFVSLIYSSVKDLVDLLSQNFSHPP